MNKMKKSLKEEVQYLRNVQFRLDKEETNAIFNKILECWKESILKAPRNVVDYSINIVMKNVNGLNFLGKISDLYETWGDNYFIDYQKSCFIPIVVDQNGKCSINNEILFSECKHLEWIHDIAFSLTKLISLCEQNNYKIFIDSSQDEEYETCVEINIMRNYEKNQSIIEFLNERKK